MTNCHDLSLEVVVALKRAVVLWVRKHSTWTLCTWWLPWCPRSLRALPALLEAIGEQRFAPRGWWWSTFCCSLQGAKLPRRCAQRYHSRNCSWCSWLCWRFQCRDAPASTLCRCRYRSFPFCVYVSFLLYLLDGPWPFLLSSHLYRLLWETCFRIGVLNSECQSAAAALLFISARMQIRDPSLDFRFVSQARRGGFQFDNL